MGDPIEITTWPRHQNIFYRVTSSALLVDVKAPGNATIGLAKKPGDSCDYWICIGDSYNSRSWIKKGDEHCKKASTPHILTSDEYRRFWISWNGDNIQLGRYGETKSIVSYTNKTKDLNYVTFSVLEQTNPVYWKFELPPVVEKPRKIRHLSGGKLNWKAASNQLPDGAMIGGFENEILYIIRALHRGSLTPGKFVPSEGTGYISWGGQSTDKSEFEVLCGFDCAWVPSWEDRIPVGAVEGGYSESNRERLYVGRAVHEGHMIPGKVQPSHKVCYIAYKGQEIGKKSYEILIEPYRNQRCVNKMFVSEMQAENYSESEGDDDGGDAYSNHSWPNEEEEDNYHNSDDDVYGWIN